MARRGCVCLGMIYYMSVRMFAMYCCRGTCAAWMKGLRPHVEQKKAEMGIGRSGLPMATNSPSVMLALHNPYTMILTPRIMHLYHLYRTRAFPTHPSNAQSFPSFEPFQAKVRHPAIEHSRMHTRFHLYYAVLRLPFYFVCTAISSKSNVRLAINGTSRGGRQEKGGESHWMRYQSEQTSF